MANKGKQKGVHDQSSAEVEQLLPVHNPRNLYTSDSPVIKDLDSDEELYKSAEEVVENIDPDGQSDGTANKNRVDQNQGTLGNSSNSNEVQQGSQAHIINLLKQIIRNTNTGPTHRAGSCSGLKKLVRTKLALLLSGKLPMVTHPHLLVFPRSHLSGRTVATVQKPAKVQLQTSWLTWQGVRSHHGMFLQAEFSPIILLRRLDVMICQKCGRQWRRPLLTGLKSLKSQWKKDTLSQTAKAAERSKLSRKQRKYQFLTLCYQISASLCLTYLTTVSLDSLWSLDKHGAFTHIHAGSQKIRQTVHAPPCLPVNAYDPKWLESRETLYVRHVLCPKEDPYRFDHPPDVIALAVKIADVIEPESSKKFRVSG
ncbi:hypothetical protein EDB85DRAFT_1899170 [Lactarius pseudohatsudake]|nr:hypothetical protein EDB85DRAFT_1899170 [Lactarius pseudohatsudake]